MGAGISANAWRARTYRSLKKTQRDLEARGIACSYRNLEVRGSGFVVYFAGCGPASNGGRMSWLVLRFNATSPPNACRKGVGDVDYTDFHTRDIPEFRWGGFSAGVARVVTRLCCPRLEYLRQEIEAERISYGEIAELEDLAEYIDPSDTLLREWAGIPED